MWRRSCGAIACCDYSGGDLLIEVLLEIAPEGRPDCSHGWSAAGTPASATHGTRHPLENRPGGAAEMPYVHSATARKSRPLPPLPGRISMLVRLTTGCACRSTGGSPPVATY